MMSSGRYKAAEIANVLTSLIWSIRPFPPSAVQMQTFSICWIIFHAPIQSEAMYASTGGNFLSVECRSVARTHFVRHSTGRICISVIGHWRSLLRPYCTDVGVAYPPSRPTAEQLAHEIAAVNQSSMIGHWRSQAIVL